MIEPIRFAARDGYDLAGTLHRPEGEPRYAVLVTSGTGFPMRFYGRFARFLAERGALVLTYDFRGIGDSAPDTLKGFEMDYPDWGRLDMPAALDALRAAAPGLKTVHVGHSVGGHFAGFMDNQDQIDRHAFVSVGTGYWGRHHLSYRPLELWFWWGLGTWNLIRHGHVPTGGGWSGAPLPRGVFTTWRRWCQKPEYFMAELKDRLKPHHFDAVKSPIRSWIFPDDPIATPRTGRDLMAAYSNAPWEIVVRTPAEIGVRAIGHDGAFRAGRERLWTEIADWLEG